MLSMSRLKDRLINLNISFNKEIVRFVIIAVLLTVGFTVGAILSQFYPLFIIYAIVMVVFSYFYFSRYKSMERKQNDKDVIEFVNLFAFFRIYLKNGFGVYSSLKEVTNFASSSLREKLIQLTTEIDEDKTIAPFIHFARHFSDLLIEEMMVSIYQMVDDGTDSNHLIQFELIYDKFSELQYDAQLKNKDRGLSNITTSALVGSAYLIITITLGVFTLIGEMLNGI